MNHPVNSSTKTELVSCQIKNDRSNSETVASEKILCRHCKRTATNGIGCLGICVADSDY